MAPRLVKKTRQTVISAWPTTTCSSTEPEQRLNSSLNKEKEHWQSTFHKLLRKNSLNALLARQPSPCCCNPSMMGEASNQKHATTICESTESQKTETNNRSVLTEEQHVQRKITCESHLTHLLFVQEGLQERTARKMSRGTKHEVPHIVLLILTRKTRRPLYPRKCRAQSRRRRRAQHMARIYLECSTCWPWRASPRHPKDPKRATPHPFPAGPLPRFLQTRRVFFADFLIVFVNSVASGPNDDVAVPARAFRAAIPPHLSPKSKRQPSA